VASLSSCPSCERLRDRCTQLLADNEVIRAKNTVAIATIAQLQQMLDEVDGVLAEIAHDKGVH